VVTRSSEDADSLGSLLQEKGAEVLRLPTIAIEFPEDLLDAATGVVKELRGGSYDWVVFSSRPGVTALSRAMARAGIGPELFEAVNVGVVGSATRAAFEALAGRAPDVVPGKFTGSDLAVVLGDGPGRVLLPRPEGAPRSIIDELSARGWEPQEVPLYRTVRGKPDRGVVERVTHGDFDVLTFTSGSTVRFFAEIVGELALNDTQRIVVIGPATEAVARKHGFEVDAVAHPHTSEGVVKAVARAVGR